MSKFKLFTKYEKKFFFLLLLIFCTSLYSQRLKDSVRVEIDFSRKNDVKSLSGFLHYDNIRALERDIVLLKPKYWRIGWSYKSIDDIKYLRSFGIQPILVLSDIYGYPGKKNNKEWSHPLRTERLKNIIEQEYKKFGNTVIYDIWNEPFHQAGFGDFDKEEYYQIFKKSYDIIRSLEGGEKALITGPSFDNYNENEMDDFLNFCNNNNIRIDILSWHEFRDGEYYKQFDKDVYNLKNKILPKYPKVGVKSIVLNEIINQYSQFSASEVLQVFKMLEKNKIDGACKGCWAESDGVFNCNNSINGLLDHNHKPRAVWWAYKIYAQSIKNRVEDDVNYDKLSVFASYDSKGQYIIINNNSGNKLINTEIILKDIYNLYKKSEVKYLTIYQIPDTKEQALEKMLYIGKKQIKINKSVIKINLESLLPKSVYYLSIVK